MDIRLYIARDMQRGLKNSTVNTTVSRIKTFYQWMYDNEYIKRNPAKLIKNVKFDKFVRKSLTDEEFEKLKDVCKTEREKAIVAFLFSTATRVSEVARLNKNDIDWNTNSCYVFGKGKKERKVKINANSKLFLLKYLNSRKDDNPALFVASKKPYNRLSIRSIEETIHNLGVRAGINTNVCPHKLRHGAAMTLTKRNVPISIISKYLGHSSTSVTEIYSRALQQDVETCVEKFLT